MFEVEIDASSETPLNVQLYQSLREAILSGRLLPGEEMPSTRRLAGQLGISRNTVLDSYGRLIAEGYIVSKAASRTFVSRQLPAGKPSKRIEHARARLQTAEPALLSQLGKRLVKSNLSGQLPPRLSIDFYPFRTAFSELPLEEWARILWRVSRQPDDDLLEYGERAGSWSLRQVICDEVVPHRGIDCSPEQVIIVAGWQQGLDIIARTFLDPGDTVAVENPSFYAVFPTLKLLGAKVVPIAVDQEGMVVEELFRRSERFKLVCLTPSHQFPTGTVLSLRRRLLLLEWAKKSGCLILEDDLDSEHCYESRPIPALKTLDSNEQVFYLETFSRSLYPSFGIGYLIAPERYAQVVVEARRLVCDAVSMQLQQALYEFINGGHLLRHRKRMKPIYHARREALLQSLARHANGIAHASGTQAGLHVLVRFDGAGSDAELIRRAADLGVGIMRSAHYYFHQAPRGEFVLGYADLSESKIKRGIQLLARALKAGG